MSEPRDDRDQQIKELLARVEALEANAPGDALTLGIMSGDLDYTIAAFIIALGAAAYDMQVDMFFTFWATSALRDPQKTPPRKDFMSRLFGFMLPKGAPAKVAATSEPDVVVTVLRTGATPASSGRAGRAAALVPGSASTWYSGA